MEISPSAMWTLTPLIQSSILRIYPLSKLMCADLASQDGLDCVNNYTILCCAVLNQYTLIGCAGSNSENNFMPTIKKQVVLKIKDYRFNQCFSYPNNGIFEFYTFDQNSIHFNSFYSNVLILVSFYLCHCSLRIAHSSIYFMSLVPLSDWWQTQMLIRVMYQTHLIFQS